MRLLLVDVNTPRQSHGETRPASQVALPLGVMYLSAAVKQAFQGEMEVKLVDAAVDLPSAGDFEKAVGTFHPDIVGFRVLSIARGLFDELVRTARQLVPRAVLVAGGPHVCAEPCEVMNEVPVDYAVIGEGERCLVLLLRHLRGELPIDRVSGLYYRRDGRVVSGQPPESIQDIDALPLPDYGLLDQQKYESVLSYANTKRRQGAVLSSRGCPYACSYCLKLLGSGYRPRGVDAVVDEIEFLQKEHGIRDIMFVDDTFNVQAARVEAIFRQILSRHLQCNYYFPAGLRPELMTENLVDVLIEGGTCWITYAIETVTPRLMELVGRLGSPERAARVIDYTAQKRIMVGLFSMVGFPTETHDEAMRTLEYLGARNRVTMPYLFAVRYFPGTALTRLAKNLGAIGPEAEGAAFRSYHDISESRTSTLTKADFQDLFTYYMKEILLNSERLNFAMDVQESFLSPDEMASAYGLLLGRRIEDARRALRHALSSRV